MLQGRFHAGCDDVRAVAHPVLRHRILTNFNAEAEGIKPDDVIDRLIEAGAAKRRRRVPQVGPGCRPGPELTDSRGPAGRDLNPEPTSQRSATGRD